MSNNNRLEIREINEQAKICSINKGTGKNSLCPLCPLWLNHFQSKQKFAAISIKYIKEIAS